MPSATRPLSLIVSQGRVADRTPGAIAGAAATGAMLAELLAQPAQPVGTPSPAVHDGWREAMGQAAPTLRGLAEATAAALDAGRLPVLALNTCAAATATVPAAAQRLPGLRLLWIDAHGDFHTPATTASGYLGGMVLAAACGRWDSGHGAGQQPERVVLVGARDLDPEEVVALAQAGVRVLPPASATPEAVREALGEEGPLWVHLDWDVLDPGWVPTAYRVPGGLLPAQLSAILCALPLARLAGLEVAEYEAEGDDPAAGATAIEVMRDVLAPWLAGLR